MSNERRIAPRKIFSIPIRVRPLVGEPGTVTAGASTAKSAVAKFSSSNQEAASSAAAKPARVLDMDGGETVSLSRARNLFQETAKSEGRSDDGALLHSSARIDRSQPGTGALLRPSGTRGAENRRAPLDGNRRGRRALRASRALPLRQLS